jgi:phosphatidylglycerophosphatase A
MHMLTSHGKNNIIIDPKMLLHPIHCFSFGFGAGLLPKMPGTWGTIVTFLFFLPMMQLSSTSYLLVFAVLTVFSIYAADYTSKSLGEHDHSAIVCDEIVGYLLVLFFIPQNLICMLLSFVLFRLFDIVKPWPINFIDENIAGGLGIVVDDIAAALYAIAVFLLLQLLYSYVL